MNTMTTLKTLNLSSTPALSNVNHANRQRRSLLLLCGTALTVMFAGLAGCGSSSSPLRNRVANTSAQTSEKSTITSPVTAPGSDGASETPKITEQPLPSEMDTRMIGSNRQMAVRNECWYALDPDWLSKTNDSNGPSGISKSGLNGVSRWHYLSTDGNNAALRYVLTTYQGYVSDLIPGTDGKLRGGSVDDWTSRLADDKYAMNYAKYTGVGHGCQCVSFATIILYRALGGYKFSWNWGSINASNYPSATSAQPGDLVFYKSGNAGHLAVCVQNNGSNSITVVDSNYIGGDGNEVIARHAVSYNTIGNTWKTYSGKNKWY